jgi:hypothetical protein
MAGKTEKETEAVNHLVNANKKVSKTPRTDRQPSMCFGPNLGLYVKIGFAKQLERQLAGANKRIKELEKENDSMRADLLLWDKAGIGFTTEEKP